MRVFPFRFVTAAVFACAVFGGADAQEASSGTTSTLGAFSQVNAEVLLAISSPDYMATAGDLYTLTFSPGIGTTGGASAVDIPLTLDGSYRLRVANMGIVNAAGKSYPQLKRQVEALVLENYPLSPVLFSMYRPATFNVYLKGEVKAARTIPAWALTRLSEILLAVLDAGQAAAASQRGQTRTSYALLTEYSSIRDVTVLSSSGVKKTYDLYRASRDGDLSQDPYLRPGDIITVGRLSRRVSIDGAVERPGAYQLLDGENLKDLIEKYAGGFTAFADPSGVEILRYVNSSQKQNENALVKLTEAEVRAGKELRDYDYVTVRPSTNMYPVVFLDRSVMPYFVTVSGAVRAPGRYPYAPDRTWEYYVALAGGFIRTENAFQKVTVTDLDGKKMNRAALIRPETIITANSNNFLYYWNQYAPVITTSLSIFTTYLALRATLNK